MSYANGPKIVTDGLVLCLDAANRKSYPGSGNTWFDLSGNGNNCTITGATFDGGNNGSFNFDGNDYGSITRTSSLSPTSELTQEVFISQDLNTVHVYIGLQYGTSSQNSYALWYDGDSWNGLIRNSGGMRIQQYPITPALNTWYHLVHTYDGSNQKIYVDGILKDTYASSGAIVYDASNTEITISADNNGAGHNSGKTGFLNGSMSLARIYSRALSANEVQQNYNALKGRYGLT